MLRPQRPYRLIPKFQQHHLRAVGARRNEFDGLLHRRVHGVALDGHKAKAGKPLGRGLCEQIGLLQRNNYPERVWG